MAKPPKSLDPDYLFNIFRLNKWFAITSLALLASVGLMVKHDYDREWKAWQRKFRTLELEKTKAQISEIDAQLAENPEYKEASQALATTTEDVKSNELKIFELKKVLAKKKDAMFVADSGFRNMKADLDALRYTAEEADEKEPEKIAKLHQEMAKAEDDLRNAPEIWKKTRKTKKIDMKSLRTSEDAIRKSIKAARAKIPRLAYQDLKEEVDKAKSNLDSATNAVNEINTQIAALTAIRDQAKTKMDLLTVSRRRLEARYHKIERSFVNDVFRDLPLLDFIDPMLKVKQIIAQDMHTNLNFVSVPRVDNCVTCHVAIDRPGFEDQPNPLKTHPRLDLILSAKSPHTTDDFGCTVCHAGAGGGLTFTNAAHSPKNEEQAKEWEKKYGWERLHHWAEPMIPLDNAEATCYGCHQKDYEPPKADKLNAAIEMVERRGCFGCHKIEGWDYTRKIGPSLKRVGAKLTHDFIFKWIRNPKKFRPTSYMPQIFDLANSSDADSLRRNTVEVQSIVNYLLSKSEPWQPDSTNLPAGNGERGKQVFGTVGCLGCHNIDDFPAPKKFKRGPDLSKIGSKVTGGWLASWLRNPKNYWPESHMPSLRLSEQEISDLVEYLVAKRDSDFEGQALPDPDPRMLQEVAFDYLRSRMTMAEARKKVSTMTDGEKQLFVGEKAISQYGCFACHTISGFEDAKPIGPELTTIASKPLGQIDFGFAPIEKTTEAYIYQKIMNSRVFDGGKIKEPLERARMPYFAFTPEEGKQLMTLLLGLRSNDIPDTRRPRPTGTNVLKGEGRRLIANYGCRGCHTIEGTGGDVLSYYEDPSLGPPNLQGEGRKVQQDWLFHFLGGPTTIRPWLKIRMPTFGLNEQQRNTLIGYFRASDRDLPVLVEEQPTVSPANDKSAFGKKVFDQMQCMSCHPVGPPAPDRDTSNLAPNLAMAKSRLRYEWIVDWLTAPGKLLPGTRMPNLFYNDDRTPLGIPVGDVTDPDKQMDAVRDHIWNLR